MSVTDGIGQTPCSFEHYLVNVRVIEWNCQPVIRRFLCARSGDETAEAMALCRREFIRSYEDFCRHSFRPHPSNVVNRYLTAFSSSGLTPSTRNLDLCPCVPFDGGQSFRSGMSSCCTAGAICSTLWRPLLSYGYSCKAFCARLG